MKNEKHHVSQRRCYVYKEREREGERERGEFDTYPVFLSTISGAKVLTNAMTLFTLVCIIVCTSSITFLCAGFVPKATPALFTKMSMDLNSSGNAAFSSPICCIAEEYEEWEARSVLSAGACRAVSSEQCSGRVPYRGP